MTEDFSGMGECKRSLSSETKTFLEGGNVKGLPPVTEDFSGMGECKRSLSSETKTFLEWGNVKGLFLVRGRLFWKGGM